MSLSHRAGTTMLRPSMYFQTLLHVTLLSGMVHAFFRGCISFRHKTCQQYRHHTYSSAAAAAAAATLSRRSGSSTDATTGRWISGLQLRPSVSSKHQLRLMPNEYDAFFNKASRLGADATRGLTPEERAQRALEGEKLEDDIIEIATVLREKADAMVAETGAINFEVIQPMIDEIAVLKSKYKVVMGASETTSATTDGDDSSGGAATDGDQEGSRAS
ncbi:unnamed protein product [Pylaiella littoralis]